MTNFLTCLSSSVEDTRAIGEALAPLLCPGDVVALSGDLGAGKTALVQGAARGLGVEQRVTSPTFVIVREYEGQMRVVHVDVYRLQTLGDVIDLGYEEIFDPSAVIFVEWGVAVRALLPDEWLQIEIHGGDDDERMLYFRAHGQGWASRIPALTERLRAWRDGEA